MDKKIIIIEGPSGVGKDSFMNGLIEQHPGKFEKIVSYTTREMRPGEINGVTYNFISEQEFKNKIGTGEIFEFTVRHGTYRGMSKSLINKILDSGKIALKDNDIIGVRALRDAYPNMVTAIFVTTNKDIIRKRLEKRGELNIEQRLKDFDTVHEFIHEYNHIITNNGTIQEGVDDIWKIINK